jgi:hypothetical protein
MIIKNEINKIKGRHFDLAFLVLDPRQEENFLLGFDYFMRNTQTEAVIPMHFWDDSSVIDKLLETEVSAPYRDKIIDTRLL